MRLSVLSFLLLFCVASFGHTNQYQNLLDKAFAGHNTLFVYSKPVSNLQVDVSELWRYSENLKDHSNHILDTAMFLQIIQNSKNVDTAIWKDNELPFALLVTNKDENVLREYAIKKLLLTDKKQIRFYNKQINQFNTTEPYNKDITSFSRPVFDNTRQFAIVEWDTRHGRLGGGGSIVLYQLQNNIWKEFGIINNWKY